ncbi:MAG TPA: glycosyltransferase family 39 protein [Patescibacteria group bacterium]|jgi:4-amino-4-deoxy-L-arabinose transferase-like glycosyltransferase|nr:glycosyltransferase family 39 protein [Patescibacteria group bacterium]
MKKFSIFNFQFSKVWILLIAIIILAAGLRLWQLGSVPPSPDWDEAALGYDAYSIMHTGRDEFGKFLPVVLRSFDDYKPALYAYLAIPTVAMLGLNIFAVRLPSALFGIISVIAVFYLVQELFRDFKYKDPLALVASFMLAISPWSLQFSRVAFEANVGDILNLLAALFLIKGVNSKRWYLFVAALFAGLSIYVYQSEKVFTPLFILLLAIIYWKKLFALSKKYLFAVVIFGLIIVTPMLFYITTNRAALLRVTGTSIFSYQTELLSNDIQKLQRDSLNNDKLGLIIDNRRFIYVSTIVSGYISHFDPNWLFITGDIARHHAPGMGIMYLFELPFILFGIYTLLFGDFDKKTKLVVFGWLLLAPVPASITTGVPHAVRTLNFLPTWQILSAIGILYAFIFFNKYKRTKFVFYLIFAVAFIFNVTYYFNQYFVQQNYYNSEQWQYGYQQAVSEVKAIGNKYQTIIISDFPPLDKSYMFFLFYLQYPPEQYQIIGENSSGSFVSHHSFGKYTFRPINWSQDSRLKNTLIIGSPAEIPKGVGAIKIINNLDGSPAIKIVGT